MAVDMRTPARYKPGRCQQHQAMAVTQETALPQTLPRSNASLHSTGCGRGLASATQQEKLYKTQYTVSYTALTSVRATRGGFLQARQMLRRPVVARWC